MSGTQPLLRTLAMLGVVAACGMGQANGDAPPSEPAMEPIIRFALAPQEPIPLPPVDGHPLEERLTLDEAQAMALAFHPAMREATGRVQAARGEWVQVGLPNNPSVGYQGTEIGDDGKAGQQGGFVSQEFITAGKRGLSRAVASREISATEQRLERTRLQIIVATRLAYFEAVAAERALVLARQLEQMGAQAVRASELRLQAQEGSRAALLQSQVEYESAAMLVMEATRRREAALRRLATVTGLDASAVPSLEDRLGDPLPELDWESTRARLLAESPELAALHFEVERAKWLVRRETAGRVPNVTMQGGVQLDHATNDTIAGVQFSVPLPVFDRNQGNIARACGELAAARAALEARELALTEELADALRDYHVACRRVARYTESILPAASQSRDLINQAYDQGELSFIDLLAAQRTYTEKSRSYLADLESAWKKWAEIDGLLVGPLDADSD